MIEFPSFILFFSSVLYSIITHFHYLIFNFGSFLPKDARVNLVDLLVMSFQTSIGTYLQTLASIQPRTGLMKFTKNYPNVRENR